ncbi:hypothetical protein L7F22_059634 [Adiantum nelumboides]|nr:hypothetical protein [Adiantum nelumboides]
MERGGPGEAGPPQRVAGAARRRRLSGPAGGHGVPAGRGPARAVAADAAIRSEPTAVGWNGSGVASPMMSGGIRSRSGSHSGRRRHGRTGEAGLELAVGEPVVAGGEAVAVQQEVRPGQVVRADRDDHPLQVPDLLEPPDLGVDGDALAQLRPAQPGCDARPGAGQVQDVLAAQPGQLGGGGVGAAPAGAVLGGDGAVVVAQRRAADPGRAGVPDHRARDPGDRGPDRRRGDRRRPDQVGQRGDPPQTGEGAVQRGDPGARPQQHRGGHRDDGHPPDRPGQVVPVHRPVPAGAGPAQRQQQPCGRRQPAAQQRDQHHARGAPQVPGHEPLTEVADRVARAVDGVRAQHRAVVGGPLQRPDRQPRTDRTPHLHGREVELGVAELGDLRGPRQRQGRHPGAHADVLAEHLDVVLRRQQDHQRDADDGDQPSSASVGSDRASRSSARGQDREVGRAATVSVRGGTRGGGARPHGGPGEGPESRTSWGGVGLPGGLPVGGSPARGRAVSGSRAPRRPGPPQPRGEPRRRDGAGSVPVDVVREGVRVPDQPVEVQPGRDGDVEHPPQPDALRTAAQQRDGAAGVAALGVGQPDRELRQRPPQVAGVVARVLPGTLEDLVGVEGQARVEQALGLGDGVRGGEHQVLGHPLDAGCAVRERTPGGVAGAGVAGTARSSRSRERVMAARVPAPRLACVMITELFDVRGRVAVVTGGTSGIGRMIAGGLAEAGARVYVSSRKADACADTAAEIGGTGIAADLSSEDECVRLAAEVGEREERVHLLVNNAGATWGAPLEEFPAHAWDKVLDLNLKAPFFLTRAFLPLLEAAGSAEDPARVGAVVVVVDRAAGVAGGGLDDPAGPGGLGGGEEAGEPAVGEPPGAPEPGVGASAQPQVERGGRAGEDGGVVEAEELAVVGHGVLGEQPAQHDQRLLEHRGAPARYGVQLPVAGLGGLQPEHRQDPPGREHRQRCELGGEQHRVAPGQHRDAGADLQGAGARRGPGAADHRVDHRLRRDVGQPQRVDRGGVEGVEQLVELVGEGGQVTGPDEAETDADRAVRGVDHSLTVGDRSLVRERSARLERPQLGDELVEEPGPVPRRSGGAHHELGQPALDVAADLLGGAVPAAGDQLLRVRVGPLLGGPVQRVVGGGAGPVAGQHDGDVGAVVVVVDRPAGVAGGGLDDGAGTGGLVGGEEAAQPAVGEPADPAQPDLRATAQPQVERAGRARRDGRVVEGEELAVVGHRLLGQQPSQHHEGLLEHRGPGGADQRVDAGGGDEVGQPQRVDARAFEGVDELVELRAGVGGAQPHRADADADLAVRGRHHGGRRYPASAAPARVATAVAERPVERRCVLRDGDDRPEQALPGRLLPGRGHRGGELQNGGDGVVVGDERVPGRDGEVPAVQDQLVEGDDPGDVGGQVQTARRGEALPGGRLAPRLRQRGEPGRDRGAPVRDEVRGVGARRGTRGLGGLLRRDPERPRQTVQVVEQGGDGHVVAGGRVVELVVADTGDDVGDGAGGRGEIEHGCHLRSGRRPTVAGPCLLRPAAARQLIAPRVFRHPVEGGAADTAEWTPTSRPPGGSTRHERPVPRRQGIPSRGGRRGAVLDRPADRHVLQVGAGHHRGRGAGHGADPRGAVRRLRAGHAVDRAAVPVGPAHHRDRSARQHPAADDDLVRTPRRGHRPPRPGPQPAGRRLSPPGFPCRS